MPSDSTAEATTHGGPHGGLTISMRWRKVELASGLALHPTAAAAREHAPMPPSLCPILYKKMNLSCRCGRKAACMQVGGGGKEEEVVVAGWEWRRRETERNEWIDGRNAAVLPAMILKVPE